MKFGCNVSKDKSEEEKAKLSPYLKKQLGCNNARKKTIVFKYDYFVFAFLPCSVNIVHTECTLINVLILGSDHINLTPTS